MNYTTALWVQCELACLKMEQNSAHTVGGKRERERVRGKNGKKKSGTVLLDSSKDTRAPITLTW